jgi:hypothetical protein
MPLQPFLIAPLKSGTQTNPKPWLIADDAYQLLQNVYCWRSRIKKRIGARVMDTSQPDAVQQQFTRLRINIFTTDGGGNVNVKVPGSVFKVGQMFSIGTDYFTVVTLGTPGVMITNSATAILYTFNTTTGFVDITDSFADTIVYFYPAEPVMHIGLFQKLGIDTEITIAFDTQFSYQYTLGIGWQRSGTAQGLWTGNNSQFHTSANWRGTNSNSLLLFVVNNKPADGIQYYDGANWATLAPPVTDAAGNTITTALIVFVFKGRLLLFNTQEVISAAPQTFQNRVRISQLGSPLEVDAWRDDIEGKGDFIDAPTTESITSVQALKDRLIVFFENSTYELVFTDNNVQPFVFQKINTELGVESTHSIIAFDKVVLGMGSTGVHACNGLNVDRIDSLIPQTIFDIANENNGPSRVHGIRDYYEEVVYWTYPSDDAQFQQNNVYPNRMLLMDYINQTWAFFDDSITTFGYFYLQQNLLIWANIKLTWSEMNMAWSAGEQYDLFRAVIAGNQEGWTFIMTADLSRNCMSLQITNITVNALNVVLTVIDHNIVPTAPFIFIDNIQAGGSTLEDLNGTIQQAIYISNTQIQINIAGLAGVYLGGGTIERVSQIMIQTKQYNFFPQEGRNCFLGYADFYVDKTPSGQITVDYQINDSDVSMLTDAANSGALIGTGILETSAYAFVPFEAVANQLWHRIYFQSDGNVVQIVMYWSTAQTLNLQSIQNNFVLNAVQYWAQPTSPYVR